MHLDINRVCQQTVACLVEIAWGASFRPPPLLPPPKQFWGWGGGAEGRNMTEMLTIWQLTMRCCHHSVTVSLSSSPVYSESSTHPLSNASTLCSLSPSIKSLSPALWKSNISLTNHCVLAGWEFSPFIWNQAPIHRPTLQLCAHCHHPLKVCPALQKSNISLTNHCIWLVESSLLSLEGSSFVFKQFQFGCIVQDSKSRVRKTSSLFQGWRESWGMRDLCLVNRNLIATVRELPVCLHALTWTASRQHCQQQEKTALFLSLFVTCKQEHDGSDWQLSSGFVLPNCRSYNNAFGIETWLWFVVLLNFWYTGVIVVAFLWHVEFCDMELWVIDNSV